MEIPPKTLSLITKLLTLASDAGATPAEAANAMRKARAMMDDYDLTEEEVAAAAAAGENPLKDRPACYRSRRMEPAGEILLAACCLLFDCRHYLLRMAQTQLTYRVYGREGRIAVTIALWTTLRNEVARQGKKRFPGKSKRALKQRRQFALGYAERVRIRAFNAAAEPGGEPGLIRISELDRYRDELGLSAARKRKTGRLNGARTAGFLAGGKAHLGADGLGDSETEPQTLLLGD